MYAYCNYENNRLTIGNALIERSIDFSRGYPVCDYIENKTTGHRWQGNGELALFNLAGFDFVDTTIRYEAFTSDNGGLSEAHCCAAITYENKTAKIRQLFEIYDDLPFITTTLSVIGGSAKQTDHAAEISADGIESEQSAVKNETAVKLPAPDTIDCFSMDVPHLRVDAVTLIDKTDGNDCLVKRASELLYDHKENTLDGSMFILSAYQQGEGLFVAKEAPCIASQLARRGNDLRVRTRRGGFVSLCGSGIADGEADKGYELEAYGATVGVSTGGYAELTRLYKRHYAKVCLGSGNLFAMSNTWGDRSRDAALCEPFMLNERRCAERIGVDILQIDDGWQKGLSANSAKKEGKVWTSGYYREDPEFWSVSPEKFPSGLSPLMSDGVELALWFSADGDNDYENFERDAKRLADLSREYGVKQFKLDGMTLKSKLGEKRIRDFMRLARGYSGTELTFNLDITAGVRLGYLSGKETGTLFVENRYTDFINYYPHTTLKNLWMLAHYFPARKFQFELLNNQRNAAKYEAAAPGDKLAPANYAIDWLFASVMVSNPLIWMEMQHLDETQTEKLAQIVAIWKKERQALYHAEIIPIGGEPDGIVYTGFRAETAPGEGYLILLRESAQENIYTYQLGIEGDYACELLAATGGFSIENDGIMQGEIAVRFNEERSYAFIRYR